jgi:hypothetical protein
MDDLKEMFEQLFDITNEIAATAKIEEDGKLKPVYLVWQKRGMRVNVLVGRVMCGLDHIWGLGNVAVKERRATSERVEVRRSVLW